MPDHHSTRPSDNHSVAWDNALGFAWKLSHLARLLDTVSKRYSSEAFIATEMEATIADLEEELKKLEQVVRPWRDS